jgi:hypothetical protein
MTVPLGLAALGVMGSAALATLASELTRRAMVRPATTQESEENNMSYDLVGIDDLGAIGGADILLSGIEDLLVGSGEDEALLEALSVSGAGNTELVGAVQAAKAQRAAAVARQVALRNAGTVVKRGLDRKRRYPLGFVPTDVAANATEEIPASPQNLFRAERLVIPSDIAFDLGVTDIKMGNQSQFAQSAEVPAALFSEVAINTGVTFDTAEVGNQISIAVRNKTGSEVEFTAGMVGSIAK